MHLQKDPVIRKDNINEQNGSFDTGSDAHLAQPGRSVAQPPSFSLQSRSNAAPAQKKSSPEEEINPLESLQADRSMDTGDAEPPPAQNNGSSNEELAFTPPPFQLKTSSTEASGLPAAQLRSNSVFSSGNDTTSAVPPKQATPPPFRLNTVQAKHAAQRAPGGVEQNTALDTQNSDKEIDTGSQDPPPVQKKGSETVSERSPPFELKINPSFNDHTNEIAPKADIQSNNQPIQRTSKDWASIDGKLLAGKQKKDQEKKQPVKASPSTRADTSSDKKTENKEVDLSNGGTVDLEEQANKMFNELNSGSNSIGIDPEAMSWSYSYNEYMMGAENRISSGDFQGAIEDMTEAINIQKDYVAHLSAKLDKLMKAADAIYDAAPCDKVKEEYDYIRGMIGVRKKKLSNIDIGDDVFGVEIKDIAEALGKANNVAAENLPRVIQMYQTAMQLGFVSGAAQAPAGLLDTIGSFFGADIGAQKWIKERWDKIYKGVFEYGFLERAKIKIPGLDVSFKPTRVGEAAGSITFDAASAGATGGSGTIAKGAQAKNYIDGAGAVVSFGKDIANRIEKGQGLTMLTDKTFWFGFLGAAGGTLSTANSLKSLTKSKMIDTIADISNKLDQPLNGAQIVLQASIAHDIMNDDTLSDEEKSEKIAESFSGIAGTAVGMAQSAHAKKSGENQNDADSNRGMSDDTTTDTTNPKPDAPPAADTTLPTNTTPTDGSAGHPPTSTDTGYPVIPAGTSDTGTHGKPQPGDSSTQVPTPLTDVNSAKQAINDTGDIKTVRTDITAGKYGDPAKAQEMLQTARTKIVRDLKKQVVQAMGKDHPDVIFDFPAPGTPKFTSDLDVTVEAKSKKRLKAEKLTGKGKLSQDAATRELTKMGIAEGHPKHAELMALLTSGTLTADKTHLFLTEADIKAEMLASIDASRKFYEIRPDCNESLDTNFYVNLRQDDMIRMASPLGQAKILQDQSTVSKAEARRNMSDDEWAEYKEKALKKFEDNDLDSTKLMEEFRQAELIASDLAGKSLDEVKQELADKIKAGASSSEIRELASRVKLIEHDSYGSMAAVQEVVGHQQPAARMTDEVRKYYEVEYKKMGIDESRLNDPEYSKSVEDKLKTIDEKLRQETELREYNEYTQHLSDVSGLEKGSPEYIQHITTAVTSNMGKLFHVVGNKPEAKAKYLNRMLEEAGMVMGEVPCEAFTQSQIQAMISAKGNEGSIKKVLTEWSNSEKNPELKGMSIDDLKAEWNKRMNEAAQAIATEMEVYATEREVYTPNSHNINDDDTVMDGD